MWAWRMAAALAAACAGVIAAGAEPAGRKPLVRFSASPAVAGEVVAVDVTAIGADGAPADVAVSLDADVGKLPPPERLGPGQYRFSLPVPRRLPASRTIVLLVRGGGPALDLALPVVPGPAATLQVSGPPSCPVGDAACRIELRAEDAFGNGAREVPQASADLGRLTPPATEGPGRWVFFYHPPHLERPEGDRVRVALGDLRAEHRLSILPQRLRLGLAPLAGLVLQQGRPGLAAGAQAQVAWLLRSGWWVGGGLEGGWWSTTRRGWLTVPADPTPARLRVDVDRSQLALGLVGLAERPLGEALALRLSIGAGAVRVTSVARVSGQPSVSASGWAPSASASAALGWRLRAGTPFVEARAAWEGDARLATDSGAKAPVFLLVGYRFDVP